MEYFDVDLTGSHEYSYFEDLKLENKITPYTQALYQSGKAGVLGSQFIPEQSATKNYLKYLINEYKKNT
jgi:hypothetical protein